LNSVLPTEKAERSTVAADEPEIPIAKEKGHALDSIIGGQVLKVVRLALLDVLR
jgi:hypothetical protein